MTDLVITFPSGTRTLTAYQMQPRRRLYSNRTLEAAVPIGDGGENPTTVTFTVEITGTSLENAVSTAYTVIEEAQSATSVAYHRGTISVDKLRSHEMRAEQDAVILTLTWRIVRTSITLLGWDHSDVTWDQTDITFDAETVTE